MKLDSYRPIPFYFINTTNREDLSPKAASAAMAHLKAAGYGGCIFFNKPPTGFSQSEFLSDYWFEVVENFILAARHEQLEFWINDGYNFPPGDVAGRIEAANPTLCQHRLVRKSDGTIEPVPVAWGFPAFEEAESSRLFIELFLEQFHNRLGKYFGNGITGFFSDADNRRVNHFTLQNLNGETYYPWASNFAEEFKKEFGYEITPLLKELFDGNNPTLNRNYWTIAGKLYANWFRNNYEWCHEHGVKYTFHTSDTGPFSLRECSRSSIFSEGDPLKLYAYSDYPGTDHELASLDGGTHFDKRFFFPKVSFGEDHFESITPDFNRTKFDLRAKYSSSAAYLYGKKRVLCEAFAACGWSADPKLLRRIATWQIMQGINLFVPHAVHHRFFGETKYFAPPEFLHGSLRHGIREFNDFLAQFSFIAGQGEYVAPIAVIDPTPEVLAGRAEAEPLFELCDRLNRQPIGYVIADKESAAKFPVILDPLSNAADQLPEPAASFDGGELGWMHRRLQDGTEYILVANIWSDEKISGNLRFLTRTVAIELEPGEIAVIGGPYETYRAPQVAAAKIYHPTQAANPIREEPNMIPMHTLRAWEITESIENLSLLIPENLSGSIRCNDVELKNGIPYQLFNDAYRKFSLPTAAGIYKLHLEGRPTFTEAVYLSGDFAARLNIDKGEQSKLYEYYQLDIMVPEHMELKLFRELPLTFGSWHNQGMPFYSGSVVYEFQLDQEVGAAALELNVAGICEVRVDGELRKKMIYPPYRCELGDIRGKRRMSIRVWNTLANLFDGYCAPGGLLSAPVIQKKEE